METTIAKSQWWDKTEAPNPDFDNDKNIMSYSEWAEKNRDFIEKSWQLSDGQLKLDQVRQLPQQDGVKGFVGE